MIEYCDIGINIPSILFQFDDISVKLLFRFVAVLFPTSPSPSNNKNNNSNDNNSASNIKDNRTQWEKDNDIDLTQIPKATLRTLLWLENQKKSNTYSGTHSIKGLNSTATESIQDDGIDFIKLTEIMKQYLLSKKFYDLDPPNPNPNLNPNTTTETKNSKFSKLSKSSVIFSNEVGVKNSALGHSDGDFYDSDSDQDFPNNRTGSSSERTSDNDSDDGFSG
jgi:hypothetical protein